MKATGRIGEWFKSSFSTEGSANCVEVAPVAGGGAAVRDSKDPSGALLLFTSGEWRAFVAGVKAGQFDLA